MNAATRAASISALVALVLAAAGCSGRRGSAAATTYVSTHGISMEPGFSTGDLAVLRPAGSYDVGDVVAYRSDALDTVVMHRIVGGDGDRFVTQGDNNDWLDQDQPTQDEVLGTLFLPRPPGRQGARRAQVARRARWYCVARRALGAVRPPAARAAGTPRRRRGADRPAARLPPSRCPSGPTPARSRSASGVVALRHAGVGSVLLALPSTQTETRTVQVTQRGRFSYTGEAARNDLPRPASSRPATPI